MSVTSIDWHQKRGIALDIIDEALEAYAGYMLDDDYDAQGCLDRIMKRMRERRDLLEGKPPQPGSEQQ